MKYLATITNKTIIRYSILILALIGILFLRPTIIVDSAVFTDSTNANFTGGVFSNTKFNTVAPTGIDLIDGGASIFSGTYTSNIRNTGALSGFSNFSWIPNAPYTKELPNNSVSETAYTTGNANMSNNHLNLHLNENTGSTSFAQTSGNVASSTSYTCSGTSCPTATAGVFNNAQTFDGVDDFLISPTNLTTTLGDTATVAFWIRTTQVGSTFPYTSPTIIGVEQAGGSNDIYWGTINNTGRIGIFVGDLGVVSASPINNNQWTHIALTRNRITGQIRVYVNGDLSNTNNLTDTTIKTTAFSSIGRMENTGGSPVYFNGSIDELTTYTRLLTATEITNLYRRGALRANFQIRSCPTSTCAGVSFTGPTGTSSFYSELLNTTTGLPSIPLTTLPNNQYFQYQLSLATDRAGITPLIRSVTITFDSVLQSISFAIRNSTDTSNINTCDLGIASKSSLSQCSYRLKVTSNSVGGYTIRAITSGNLISGSTSISNASVGSGGSGGTLINGTTVGVERYGVVISPGTITGTGSITTSPSFNAGVNSVQFNPVFETVILTSTGINAPASTDVTNSSLITHNLNISGLTRPGIYTQTITYSVIPQY